MKNLPVLPDLTAHHSLIFLVVFAVGLLMGLVLMWLIARAGKERLRGEIEQLPRLEEEVRILQDEKLQLHGEIAALKAFRQADEERLAWVETAQDSMREAFLALAGQTLKGNAEDILKAHKDQLHHIVEPLDKALGEMKQNIRELEGKREGAYGELKENLGQLSQLSMSLRDETGRLTHALKAGVQQRGRWAEFQLQRLAEMAGMKERVDFHLQESRGEGRPDMVVWLPRQGCIVVDAKAPMQHYFEALETTNEEARKKNLGEHVRRVKQHVDSLCSRDYTRHLPEGSQFVVMYLPSDACLMAALDSDHQLLEYAFQKHIILAAPTTIFALLKTVATGWQQYLIDENARRILTQGQELFKRLKNFLEHFVGLGRGLKTAVDKFNEAVGSYESRLLPEVRRFQELRGADTESAPQMSMVDSQPRPAPLLEAAAKPTTD
ncbi:MAG: DNA recombination protein RmuC [Desulfobaccales bacterium]